VTRLGCSMRRTHDPPRRQRIGVPGEVALVARTLTRACESRTVEVPRITLDFRRMPRVAPGLPRDNSLLTVHLACRGCGELDHEWFARLGNGPVLAVPSPSRQPVRSANTLDRYPRNPESQNTRCRKAAGKHCVATICATLPQPAYQWDGAAACCVGFVVMSPDPVGCVWLTSLAW
jgi:hypothetical protein